VALHLDPHSQPDPERDEELQGNGAQIEIRPSSRVAELAVRSLACPSCGVPVQISAPVSWNERIACAFCESSAETRDYVREEGWPRVRLIARLG
jgi:hypothetical protein